MSWTKPETSWSWSWPSLPHPTPTPTNPCPGVLHGDLLWAGPGPSQPKVPGDLEGSGTPDPGPLRGGPVQTGRDWIQRHPGPDGRRQQSSVSLSETDYRSADQNQIIDHFIFKWVFRISWCLCTSRWILIIGVKGHSWNVNTGEDKLMKVWDTSLSCCSIFSKQN